MASHRPMRPEQLTLISEILNDAQRYNVCYTPQAKVIIELHLQQLLTAYPTLSAAYEDFTHNDGRTIGMIKMGGTLPITYQSFKYNIPVKIWISERYPQQPPIAYVTPTPDMIIKTGHSYVDPSGMVRTPYFSRWHPEHSDLMGVAKDMIAIFGNEPPLFARSAAKQPPAYTAYQQPQPHRPVYPPAANQLPSGYPNYPPAQTYPAAEPTATQSVAQGSTEGVDFDVIQKQYREMMIKALSERVTGSIYALEQELKPKVSTSEEVHGTLKQRAQQIQSGIVMLQNERETYEHNVQVMALIVGEMAAWKDKMGVPDASSSNGMKAEDVIVPRDPIDVQLLKAQGRDLAAEDALNVLDQMLQKEVIDLESYLKQIRKLCHEQYFARALAMKIGVKPRQH